MTKRTDTTSQSEAAEVLAVAELSMLGLIAEQYPRNYALLDAFAFDPVVRRVVNIQVKYRNSSRDTQVTVRSLDGVDFVVVVRGNADIAERQRQCWVIPVEEIPPDAVIRLARVPDKYLNAWHLVKEKASEIRG